MEFQRPRRIGPYEIQKQIGRGTVGVVYQARDTVRARTVAVKLIPLAAGAFARDPRELEKRFLAEGQAAAALSHPGLAALYDVGTDAASRTLFMVVEHVRGRTLEAALRDGPMGWRDALRTASSIARALHHAHAHQLVHRNLTPGNVTLLADGAPKITDLGGPGLVVGLLSPDGRVWGHPPYMSPEQALGRPADARSDLFSLGAVLYEMVTGAQAFPGPTGPEALARVFRSEPAPPGRLVRTLPAALDEVLAKALAKTPADRYADARAFAEDLDDVLQDRAPQHTPARPPSAGPTAEASPERGSRPAPHAGEVGEEGDGTEQSGEATSTLALPPGRRVVLTVLDGPRAGEVVALHRPKCLIGRAGGGADLELKDSEVSRTHVLVECHGERVLLRDLSSTNGTFVDDRRVTEVVLGDRGEFRVGRTRLRLLITDG